MSEPLNILVIEDSNADFLMVVRHLKVKSMSVRCCRVDTLDGLKNAIARERWDLVLADYNVPHLDFQESLNLLLAQLADVPVIMVTGSMGEEKAVELLKLGVWDFVLKGNLARLVPAIERSFRDNSERKARVVAEEQISQAHKMKAVGQLAAGMAHDINNILSAIYGYSHLINGHAKDNEPVKKYIQEILKASERASALTRGLLTFSRKQEVTLAVIDISSVVKENEAFLSRLIREDIKLEITCPEAPLNVLADRGQIEQVLMNLAANARDAVTNGGKLSIGTESVTLNQEYIESQGYGTPGAYVLLSVSDNGIGMDKSTQSRIFEPFFTTKEQGQGTGLGLSITYGIVKKHDGFIDIDSAPGTGTTFKIYLPAVKANAQVNKIERGEMTVLYGGDETILVCEDDPVLLKLSSEVLNYYGYRVIEAVDGQDAVNKFGENMNSFKLVILDAIMPNKNGREACKEMRKLCPDLKAIFLSGYARDTIADEMVFDENFVFVQKPVSPDVLVAKVRALLDRKQQSSVIGNITDD
jgi:signal transduction histidine kinase